MKPDEDLTVEEWYEEWQLTWIDPNCGRDHFYGIIRRIRHAAFEEGRQAGWKEGAKAQREADVAICNDLARHGFCGAFQEGGAEACRRVYGAPLAEFEEEVR